MGYKLNRAILTKKIIDLMVGFLRENTTRNRLYAHAEVTDQFTLMQSRIPCVVVKQTTNEQQRVHFDDFICDIDGHTELIPITGDSYLFGNNVQQVNLPSGLDYSPVWPWDNTVGTPSGTDIVKTIYTSGVISDSGINTGIIINVPAPQSFSPQSILYSLDYPKIENISQVTPQVVSYVTMTGVGTTTGTGTTIIGTGTSAITGTAIGTGTMTVIGMDIIGNTGTIIGSGDVTGIVNGTITGTIIGTGSMSGIVTNTGTVAITGLYSVAVGLNLAQNQFNLIFSGNNFTGTVIMPVEPNQYIVHASGLISGLSGTVMKMADVLWAGDQYLVRVTNEEELLYGLYGGIYNISMSFDCMAKSTIETQELADFVERFFVEKKFDLWDIYGIELKTWSQGGQTEKAYINEPFFSIPISITLFVEWHEYRSVDVITGASGLAIPTGGYFTPYWPPGVYANVVNYPGKTIYYSGVTVNGQVVDNP